MIDSGLIEFANDEERRALKLVFEATKDQDTTLDAATLELLSNMLERSVGELSDTEALDDLKERSLVWSVLDVLRRPVVLRSIPLTEIQRWTDQILGAVEASHLTLGPLFRQRAETYAEKVLFRVPGPKEHRAITWREVESQVEVLARGLIRLSTEADSGPIAILSENRIEVVLLDLACLTSGLMNVAVPANSTEGDVGFILKHCRASTVIVSGRDQLRKVLRNTETLPDLQHIIRMDPVGETDREILTMDDLRSRGEGVPRSQLHARSHGVRIGDLATVMYTSGTTGDPKGIRYSQRNLVTKRFARALALPEIGEHDVLLSYLPLFHTFGRFLEMLGCVFWGAEYCFLIDPSVDALLDGMRRHRPTVFISVPRKWIQLHEAIARRTVPEQASDREVLGTTRHLTGGRLKWGLSAAGHLDADIFRFFHRQGIQLLSGFGASEATGGITMTPPHDFKEDSLGTALPGIELKFDEDGELLLRGPYVMMGYLDPPEGTESLDGDGWFHTGDLMKVDGDGHIRLVDRKKDIYKNVKGQTIAPQRLENLFREFESVQRAFLAGDHREYNTLLVYPNKEHSDLDFGAMSPDEVRDHFRSLVVSVNKFVAPFERIVDFAIIDRDLDADKGELTQKGTPRRKIVAENFADVIDALYNPTSLHLAGVELTFPNWIFQTLGITAQDVQINGSTVTIPSLGTEMTVSRSSDDSVQVGSCVYSGARGPVDLGELLRTPKLWLGNEELVNFAQLDSTIRKKPKGDRTKVEWAKQATPIVPSEDESERLRALFRHTEWDLFALDFAARMLFATDEALAVRATRLLEKMIGKGESPLSDPARHVLARGAACSLPEVRRSAFQVLAPAELTTRFSQTVERFLKADIELFDAETRDLLSERTLSAEKIDAACSLAVSLSADSAEDPERADMASGLLTFLAEYGTAHPVRFRQIRALLVRLSMFADNEVLRLRAGDACTQLINGFRQWLGPTLKIAVDPETGEEYRWDDVVVVEETVPEHHRRRIMSAIKNTSLLREAAFTFASGNVFRLTDLPPGGVWIRPTGDKHGKSVYRATVQTRSQHSHELAVHVNESMPAESVEEETYWLIVGGEQGHRGSVVSTFGGYHPEQDLWTEEHISGATLAKEMRRLSRREGGEESLKLLWPFLAWSALEVCVDFWQRTGRQYDIANLSPHDIVLPMHDYHSGSRLTSLSSRRRQTELLALIRAFKQEFVEAVELDYPVLRDTAGWDVIFSPLLDVVGEGSGVEAYETALKTETDATQELRSALEEFLEGVKRNGFMPKQLYFAVQRYRRWESLNPEGTPQAKARTLREFYDTYRLDDLAGICPEVRMRFFRETVFRNAPTELAAGLDECIERMRTGSLKIRSLIDAVADLRDRLTVTTDDDYFLARIPLGYLRPEDNVDFVSRDVGAGYQSEIVVALEDDDGNQLRIRHALLPKEVERLHRLFLQAKLNVRFRNEHRYLIALNEQGQVVGGIYYRTNEETRSAHLEKIVVAQRFRRKGVADGLMGELFNRLRSAGARQVTTGFFRPEYFYSHGFKIEKKYAGLVKSLDDSRK